MKFKIPGTDTTIYLTRITTTVKGKEDEQHPGCTFDLSQLLLTVEQNSTTEPNVVAAGTVGVGGEIIKESTAKAAVKTLSDVVNTMAVASPSLSLLVLGTPTIASLGIPLAMATVLANEATKFRS